MDGRLALPHNTILDDNYRIERVVGSGGFGITYEAEDTGLGTTVAIKEYYPSDFGDRDATMSVRPKSDLYTRTFEWGRSSFLQEARTLARLEHPNIVKVTRVFEVNSTAYMVMRFEQGKDFEAWLKSLGRPPTQEELDTIAGSLLDALEMMHAADFLHRDIAPDNIMVRADGSPVLLDFGAARRAVAEMSRSVTGIIKPGYSPHEQYASDNRLQGTWSDLYALGGTLYRAVAGRPPEEATLRVDEDRMPPAAQIAKGRYRPGFLAAIDACLKVKQAERPQSVAQLRRMLLGQEPQEKAGSQPASDAAAAAIDLSPAPRSALAVRPVARQRLAVVATILLLLVAGYGALEYLRWEPAGQLPPSLEQGARDQSPEASKRQAGLDDAAKRAQEEERIAAEAETRRKLAADAAQRAAELEAEKRLNQEKQHAAEEQARKTKERESLTRSLQTALNQVGCYVGEINGQWSTQGRAALAQFAKRTKIDLPIDEPSMAALQAVVARAGRVCPLQCDADKTESNGRCVPKDATASGDETKTASEKIAALPKLENPEPARGNFDGVWNVSRTADPGKCAFPHHSFTLTIANGVISGRVPGIGTVSASGAARWIGRAPTDGAPTRFTGTFRGNSGSGRFARIADDRCNGSFAATRK